MFSETLLNVVVPRQYGRLRLVVGFLAGTGCLVGQLGK